MNIDDVIAEKIRAAAWKAAQEKKRREELAAARAKGLARRHAAKLRALAERGWELAPAFDNTSISASGA